MRLWKASLFSLLICFAAFPDTPQIDSEAVRRVARHIACQCGACKDTAVCPMSMQGCGFCVPTKNKIARMQQAGFSDQAIIDQFKKQYGPDIYRAGPSDYFWAVPYGALILGAGAILWFVLRVAKPPVPAVVGDPEYARYKDTIERDMGRFDS